MGKRERENTELDSVCLLKKRGQVENLKNARSLELERMKLNYFLFQQIMEE
jgi:hypothetical protein